MRNIRLTIAYDGTDFRGWQQQPDGPTIQGCLGEALRRIAGEPVKVVGSGRTDAGVHASNQVANFRTACPIPCPNLIKALNDLLPPTVRVKEAQEAPDDFHARYAARSKTYRYRILQAPFCSPFIARFVYHYPYALDHARMAEAARLVEGEHDFRSFAGSEGAVVGAIRESPLALSTSEELGEEEESDARPRPNAVPPYKPSAVGAVHELPLPFGRVDEPDAGGDRVVPESQTFDSRSMVRTIFSSRIVWRPKIAILAYEVRGSGFLHHMVRNVVGTLIEVGRGKLQPDDMLRILEARDRTRAGPTAPAQGLCLIKVAY